MKELSIEEKSYEAYTELINRLEDVKNAIKKQNYGIAMDILDKPYPEFQITTSTELKESEDRKIKSDIQYAVRCAYGDNSSKTESILAWIEKQGEKTSADKVEPKFKDGDYIVYRDYVWKVFNVSLEKYYELLKINNEISTRSIEDVDNNAHLWTIQDAKAGDVLASKDGDEILIFRNLDSNTSFSSYYNIKWKGEIGWSNRSFIPATKEQRDLLFQKMKEAGYEWDAEKKELKKIAQKTANLPKGEDYGIDGLYHAIRILEDTLGNVDGYQTDDGILEHKCAINAVKELYEQNPAWSEEDEQYLIVCKNALEKYQTTDKWDACIISNWLENRLKSISSKNTVTNEELTQAKKDAYNDALDKIEYHSGKPTFDDGWSAAIDYIRKKSLTPQNHWKPSEEQMAVLNEVIDYAANSELQHWSSFIYTLLKSLREQLKKLREE